MKKTFNCFVIITKLRTLNCFTLIIIYFSNFIKLRKNFIIITDILTINISNKN